LTDEGAVLLRSEAVMRIMERLGGLWRAVALALHAVPLSIRDWAYDRVAALRKRIFASPEQLCPVLPKSLVRRFES
jgi:predicted DCC family thiol-disulfide oxidoreductase YuxK